MAQLTLPAPKGKPRTPVGEAETKDLNYWLGRIGKGLEENPAKPYADKDRALIAGIRAELERRKNGGAPQPATAQPQQAIQRQASTQLIAGGMRDPAKVNEQLRVASENYHLVAPATVAASLPEGCEVAISLVHVNPDSDDVYSTGGDKFGISKAPLDSIAGAAGITWDADASRQLDDGRDPRYCKFRAVGYLRNFDGSVRCIIGTKEMDLRDGSPQIEALHARKRDGGDASKQIREMRLHILSHAETKARLRAIRSCGIKTGYPKEELRKPFAVARLMWTGRTEDPELRRMFAEKTADAMIGGMSSLYGRQAPQAPQLAAPPTYSAPAVGSVEIDEDDYEYYPPIETEGEEAPATPRPAVAPQAAPANAGDAYEGHDEERL